MHVFRDLLDKQLLDMNGIKIGKIDGIVMTAAPGGQPRLASIELGSVTLARRLGPRAARLVARIAEAISGKRYVPFRIPWNKITDIGVDVEVAVELQSTPLNAWRQRLREHIHSHIPGA